MAALQNDQGMRVSGDLSLVYVSADGECVYDLAAGDVPSTQQERIRLRIALIRVLDAIAAADNGRYVPPAQPTE